MSHGDQLSKIPEGFVTVAHTPTSPFTAVAHPTRHLYGLQFHPEVTHTPHGKKLLGNFVLGISQCHANWTMVGENGLDGACPLAVWPTTTLTPRPW